MILNLIVLVFVLAMTYWWATQGFFSALLHLGLVVVCGALALALWEPLVIGFLLGLVPQYAWTLGLLLPFALLLVVLRLGTDKLIGGNVQPMAPFGGIGGAACGAASGVLTAGIALIGIGFMPLPAELVGYQPYAVSGTGAVEKTEQSLWVPVDTLTAGFYERLSLGAFSSSTPLATHQPDLARLSNELRLRPDPNASLIAQPEAVEPSAVQVHAPPIPGLDPVLVDALGLQPGSNKLVVVDTTWTQEGGRATYDGDSTLRLPPSHIDLIADPGGGAPGVTVHAPRGYAREADAQAQARVYRLFDGADASAYGVLQTERLAWLFVVPKDHEPRFLRVRGLRLELPEPVVGSTDQVVSLVGAPAEALAEDADADRADADRRAEGEVGAREGVRAGQTASAIELTSALPAPISKNFARALEYRDSAITGGTDTARKPPGSISGNTRADRLYHPTHMGMVRLRLERDYAQSLLGRARAAAASLAGIWLTDDRGQQHTPTGYVWVQSSGDQQIRFDPTVPIRSARELPVSEMGPGDELYLYFSVPKGAEIRSYNIGSNTRQEVQLTVE